MIVRRVESLVMVPVLAALLLVAGPRHASAQVPGSPGLVSVYAGAATAPAATVTVSPGTATMSPGTTVQFSAAVSGTPNTSVVWSATGGTITSTGAYTAGSTTGTFGVKATISGGTIAGSAAVSIAAGQTYIDIYPGTSIQGQINAQPAGTAFRLKTGIHRLTTPLTPKDGDAFVGESATVLSGGRLLSSFSKSGSYWVIGGQTQQGQVQGSCMAGYPMCAYPEDLYVDNVMLLHVASIADLAPGRWYFDYGNDVIYMADDPTGHVVETTVSPAAFVGSASGVTISGLIIEKFASPAQAGAVAGDSSYGWTVQNNEVRFNHGMGIRVGNAMAVLSNNAHHNGELGMGGVGDNVRVEGNTIAYNNAAGYDYGWEGGGTKFVKTHYLALRNNWVHHNTGPGLWLDIDNIDFTIEGNTSEDNTGTIGPTPGIMIEISYGGVIRNNAVRRNGLGFTGWIWGAGILVAASGGSGLEIYGNTVEYNAHGVSLVQQNRGSGTYGAYYVQNVYVHDNTIRMSSGYTGAAEDVGDPSIFTSRNNRFQNNNYYLGTNTAYYAWMDATRTDTEWRSYGEDTTGTFVRQ